MLHGVLRVMDRSPDGKLAIDDGQQIDQRPKFEEYREHPFLVTRGVSCPSERLSKLGRASATRLTSSSSLAT